MTDITDEQKARWITLHKRKADLANSMVTFASGPAREPQFWLNAAEIQKVDAEIDSLLREMLGEEGYLEYQRELSESLAKAGLENDPAA